MNSRHVTTGITLVVLLGILAAGAVVGMNQLFAPVGADDEPSAAQTPACRTLAKGERLRIGDVRVNVFNAGRKEGLAGQTLDRLTTRGFRAGTVGNAPDAGVSRAQVWIVKGEENAGRLVARNLGTRTQVVTRKRDLGEDGVDVVVGDRFKRLGRRVGAIKVRKPQEVCPAAVPEAG